MKTLDAFTALLVGATLTFSLLGCAPAPASTSAPGSPTSAVSTTPSPVRSDAPSTPLVVSLSMPKAPKVGEAVDVTLEVTAYQDARGTTANITLPPGAQLLKGETSWQGDVMAGTPVRLVATVVFPQAGEYAIEGKALSVVNSDMTWGDLQAIYLTVKQDSGSFGYESGGGDQLSASPAPGEHK